MVILGRWRRLVGSLGGRGSGSGRSSRRRCRSCGILPVARSSATTSNNRTASSPSPSAAFQSFPTDEFRAAPRSYGWMACWTPTHRDRQGASPWPWSFRRCRCRWTASSPIPPTRVGPLFDWYANGEVEVPTAVPERWTFRTSEASAGYLRESMGRIGALVAGLLDEVRLNLVPVLLGEGIRYFDNLSNAPFALEDPRVIQGTGVTHLI